MSIQRNLGMWVNGDPGREAVRRTIDDMSLRLSQMEQRLSGVQAAASGSAGLSAQQRLDVLGLVAARSSAVIGQETVDPLVVGLPTTFGTVTSLSQGTGITLTPNPIIATGTIRLTDTAVTPGSYTYASFTVDQQGRLTAASSGAAPTGTVTSVSVVTANGVSGTVATATTTPAITLVLGAITPSSVAASGTVTGSNLSGTNTGDQSSVSGNAGTATVLQTARNINGISFNGSANVDVPAGVFVTGFATGLAAAADLFFTPGTTLGGSGTLIQRQIAVSAGLIQNLRVHTGAAQSGTGSLVVKVWVNGSASALVATVTAGGAAGTYDSGATTVSISAGDLLSVEVINNASATSAANVMIAFYLM